MAEPPEALSDTLQVRLEDGTVTVLDVRPADEYAVAHIPGSRNVPLSDLERIIPLLDPATEIVAYCRGPWCVLAHEAVAALRRHGLRARRLEGGLPDWRAGGHEVHRLDGRAA